MCVCVRVCVCVECRGHVICLHHAAYAVTNNYVIASLYCITVKFLEIFIVFILRFCCMASCYGK